MTYTLYLGQDKKTAFSIAAAASVASPETTVGWFRSSPTQHLTKHPTYQGFCESRLS
jgi:hypothetical protein